MGTIRQSLSGADLVVLSSPVHFNHVSSVFHNFIERSLVDLHVFPYVGTPFVSLVSTNGSGEQDADKFLTKMGLLFGMIKLGKAFNSNNDPFKQDAFDALVKKSAGALEHAQGVKPSLMNRLYVRSMRKIIKENPEFFPYESGVWAERGWFSMSYAELRSARAAASAPAAA
jgi:multimeric flavodoxin WrbA